MNYVGIDLHKETSWVYVVDENGKRNDSRNLSNNLPELKQYFAGLPRPFEAAVEATYNWYFLVDLLEPYAEKIHLANSYELKAFAKRHKKTDKIDARLIAHVLWKGFLPTVTIPNKYVREVREMLRYRLQLVKDRCRNIHRLKALLDKLGLSSSGDFTTYKALDRIDGSGAAPKYTDIINRYTTMIAFLTKKLSEINKVIDEEAKTDMDVIHLVTIPGIGPFSAQLIKAELIDVIRFKNFNRLCAYAGLAPRVYASAQNMRYGPLNVNRRKNVQWILLENVNHFIKSDETLVDKFERIKKRKGHNTAKVAMARDFLKVIYCVLKKHRPYRQPREQNKIQSMAKPALQGV
jgi:transposase